MSVLAGFPMVSQLTAITSDGHPSENAQFDCVPASIGASILWYQGKSQWDSQINPDKMKDAAYGENYKNMGTSASAYVPFCASLGFRLYSVDGTPAQLVALAHEYLAQQKPVVFTMPDHYVSASMGWSHVCVFYADYEQNNTRYLTALDPYSAKPISYSDVEWASMLLYNQIWIVEKEEDVPLEISLDQPAIAAYFEAVPGTSQQWKCKSTGKIVQYGILSFYRGYGNAALCGLTFLGLPVSNEIAIPGYPSCVKQYFERGVLCYDPQKLLSNPPGSGSVYPLSLYVGPGQDPLVSELQTKVDNLSKQLATQPAVVTPDPKLTVYTDALNQIATANQQIAAIVAHVEQS